MSIKHHESNLGLLFRNLTTANKRRFKICHSSRYHCNITLTVKLVTIVIQVLNAGKGQNCNVPCMDNDILNSTFSKDRQVFYLFTTR